MNRPLLILDLDETLIFGSRQPLARDPDFRVGPYHVYKRPFVDAFVAAVARPYDLAVWTSATTGYAQRIAEVVFDGHPLAFLWTRDRCTRRSDPEQQAPYWVKDLKKAKRAGYDLERVLVVDDSPQKLERNYGNLVVVDPFVGDPEDRELPALAAYLVDLARARDFRRIEKRGWRRPG